MGKMSFAGPVYGAKSLLWSYGPVTQASTGGTTALVSPTSIRVVPNYEDWYVTEVIASCSTCSSVGNSFIVKTEGGSTTGIVRPDGVSTKAATIASFATGTSTTFYGSTTVAPTAGEYEGQWVPAGSTLRLVSSGLNPQGQVSLQVMGYIRYIDSTRAS